MSSEIGALYGDKTSYNATYGRCQQIIKQGQLLRAALNAGVDPITVTLEGSTSGNGKGIRSRCVLSVPPLLHITHHIFTVFSY